MPKPSVLTATSLSLPGFTASGTAIFSPNRSPARPTATGGPALKYVLLIQKINYRVLTVAWPRSCHLRHWIASALKWKAGLAKHIYIFSSTFGMWIFRLNLNFSSVTVGAAELSFRRVVSRYWRERGVHLEIQGV